jgi:hypothetical protein
MAIKVNGTTVINDSRALSNIASVDATTVAALGAAGVGGVGYSQVSNTTYTAATYTTVDIPIPTTGYFKIIVTGSFPLPETNWNGVNIQYLDSSNNQLIAPSTIPAAHGGTVFGAYSPGAPEEYLKPIITIEANNTTNADTTVAYGGTYLSTSYTGGATQSITKGQQSTTGQIAKIRLTCTNPSVSLHGHASFYNSKVVGLG